MRKFFLIISSALLFACNENIKTVSNTNLPVDSSMVDGHPAWIIQGNIYEVNVRQYTPEGTFKAFEAHLPRLKEMGVETLWFMPINPISKKERKGPLGSYYAVADYKDVNSEFGTMEDWKQLVNKAHEMGFKVIIDWVPNHTGADHPWLKSHPEFYVRDSAGQPVSPYDWTDVKKLDYTNPQVTDSMIASMKFWITETGIDGFRCDHATGPGRAFWEKCIPELRETKSILMLAEAEDNWIYDVGFDMSYAWKFFHKSNDIAAGRTTANALDSVLAEQDSLFPGNATYLYFTSNHDENSWNLADWKTMPGPTHAPFAVLTQTMDKSVPLIYSGQEEPFLDSVRFFYKDTITFQHFERANFYKTLLNLRKNNTALSTNASFTKLATNNDKAVYCFQREKDNDNVIVMVNLTARPQTFAFENAPAGGNWHNVFANKEETLSQNVTMAPWGYVVYELIK